MAGTAKDTVISANPYGIVDLIGPVSGIALDAGKSLADAIKKARGGKSREDDLLVFKRAVLTELGGLSTTVLLDAEYGPKLLNEYPPGCMPMIAYEADASLISETERVTYTPDNVKVEELRDLGVTWCKFFMYYAPDDDPVLNRRKLQQIALVGEFCQENGVDLLLEPLVYHPTVKQGSAEYAVIKPDLVKRATKVFSHRNLMASMLKVEFPVDLAFVEGYGEPVINVYDAIEVCHRAAEAARDHDILYLSAGVTFDRFVESLQFAQKSEVDFRGFMCGRAIWADGIEHFGKGGEKGLRSWLQKTGRRRMKKLNNLLG